MMNPNPYASPEESYLTVDDQKRAAYPSGAFRTLARWYVALTVGEILMIIIFWAGLLTSPLKPTSGGRFTVKVLNVQIQNYIVRASDPGTLMVQIGAVGVTVFSLSSFLLFLILLYRCWRLVQHKHEKITPVKAVGFLFIPFFNLFYWNFIAIAGLVRRMNDFCHTRNIDGPRDRIHPAFALTLCILLILSNVHFSDGTRDTHVFAAYAWMIPYAYIVVQFFYMRVVWDFGKKGEVIREFLENYRDAEEARNFAEIFHTSRE